MIAELHNPFNSIFLNAVNEVQTGPIGTLKSFQSSSLTTAAVFILEILAVILNSRRTDMVCDLMS